jgi:hypothetical protein
MFIKAFNKDSNRYEVIEFSSYSCTLTPKSPEDWCHNLSLRDSEGLLVSDMKIGPSQDISEAYIMNSSGKTLERFQ